MTDNSNPQLGSHLAPIEQSVQRLLWTGATANGALLLALMAFAGNMEDAVEGLRLISPSILLSFVGFGLGGLAIAQGLRLIDRQASDNIAREKLSWARSQLTSYKDALSALPIDPEVARLVWGADADDAIRQTLSARLQAAQNAWESGEQSAAAAVKQLAENSSLSLKLSRSARRWLSSSFVAAMLAVATLGGQAWLSPLSPSNAELTDASDQVLPPCEEGRSSCDPWERAWKSAPPVGTILPGVRP